MASAEDLASTPLFASLSDDERQELARWFHVQNASEGTRLVGEGAPGYTFFVLTDGTADVTSEGKHLATLTRGDYFGEIAILGAGRRTATVTSTSSARLLVMFGTEFRRLESAHPAIASQLVEEMQKRLDAAVSEHA